MKKKAVPALFMAIAMAPQAAHAGTGNTFFETVGYCIALGTVLGASTLPFYDQPGSNLMNLAYGAAAGTVAGLGIAIFGGSGRSDRPSDELSETQRDFGVAIVARNEFQLTTQYPIRYAGGSSGVAPVRRAGIWLPLVSLTW